MLLLFPAFAGGPPEKSVDEPVPVDLIGQERTPDLPIACELLVQDHDAAGTPWRYRISLSAPDEQGRAWIQRVTLGGPDHGVPPSRPVTGVHELDARQRFFDARVADHPNAFVKPRAVDFSVWPLSFAFIAPRADRPAALGAYRVSVNQGVKRSDWGSCILTLRGPADVGGCTMLEDERGSCLAAYVKRHGLRGR